MGTMKDPELLKEASKSRRIEIDPLDGRTIAAKFADLYQIDEALLAEIKRIIGP